MKRLILSILIILLFATSSQSGESVCKAINAKGRVDSKNEFSKSTNKMFKSKGIKYKTTPKEVENTILNFCKENPYADEDGISKHFIQISEVLVATGQ